LQGHFPVATLRTVVVGIEKSWSTSKRPFIDAVMEDIEKRDDPRLKPVVLPIDGILNLEK